MVTAAVDNGTPQVLEVPGLATVTITGTHVKVVLNDVFDGSVDFTSSDIDDLHDPKDWVPGQVFFDSSDTSEASDARLQKFMEVAYYWDHDGDGVYDADHVIRAINAVMPQKRRAVYDFMRPADTVWSRLCFGLLPKAPERHILMGFGDLKKRFRLWHYLTVAPMLFIFIGLNMLQLHFFKWMKELPLSVALGAFTGSQYVLGAVLVVLAYALFIRRFWASTGNTMSPHTFGFFSKAAVFEEQAFREGAENWNFAKKIRSCLLFGLVHQANLFYPLVTILPLSVGGGLLMYAYLHVLRRTKNRRTAVMAAGVLHRVYNRVVLVSLALILTYDLLVKFNLLQAAIAAVGAICAQMLYHDLKTKAAQRAH